MFQQLGSDFLHGADEFSSYSLALLVPLALHILIFYLAWRAIRQIGIHPDHGSLLVAALAVFLYFSFLPFLTAALYRFAPRLLHG
jgi:hypothetical protein